MQSTSRISGAANGSVRQRQPRAGQSKVWPFLRRAAWEPPASNPDEVRNLPGHVELLFLAGQRPIVVQKLRYFDKPELRGQFDPAEVVH